MGYGLIGTNKGQDKIDLLAMGSIKLSKYKAHQLRLKVIFEKVTRIIEEYKPDVCAIEAPFYAKNAQSLLKLGRAQGVCILAAMTRDIHVIEYSPRKIKQAITGNGNASKEQVAKMLQAICKYEEQPKYLDASDALATAICHHYQSKSKISGGGNYSGWADFVKKNPKRSG